MKKTKEPYFYIAPSLIIIIIFMIVPIFLTAFFSFTNANMLTFRKFNFDVVGFSNYLRFFQSSNIKDVMISTFIYLLGCVVFVYIGGLFVALLLNQNLKLKPLFRGILIIPWAIPQVVLALLWKWMLNSQYGVLKYFLLSIGIVSKDFTFLGSSIWAMVSLLIVSLWRQYPIAAVMLLAGLKSIPADLYEAASIDGANYFQKLFYITLPGLKYVSSVLILLLSVWSIGNFVVIWLITAGGPADTTAVVSIFSYLNAFKFGKLGYGAAIGVIGLIISLLITVFYYKLFMASKK